MDKTKDYSLFADNIGDAVADFVDQDKSLSWTVNMPTATQHVYRITNGKETGVITFYFKKSGLVSINPQGGLSEICDRCCDYVIRQTTIPNLQKKSFSIRGCLMDNYDYFKVELVEQHKFKVNVKPGSGNSVIKEGIIVEGGNRGKVTATLYSNGTFMIQGNVTPAFVEVMTEAVSWLLDADNADKVGNVISLENVTNMFSTDINVLIPNLSVCGDTDNVIMRMVMTSIALFNSGVIVDDYGCYTFGMLKALEGLLKLRLEIDYGVIDKLGDYFYYDTSSHSHRVSGSAYDSNIKLKMAISKTYNYWNSRRHSSFHADAQISTSTMYTYEDALAIGTKCLECINDVCNNW